jgi:tRNA (guanine-N7-)-methyltransferase
MASSVNNKIRKIYWNSKEFIKESFRKVRRRKLRETFDYNNYKMDPLNLSTLPYPTKWKNIFRYKNLWLEIGTGHGELIDKLSKDNPKDMYVGFEIITKFAKMSNKKVHFRPNAFVYKAEAYKEIPYLFAENSLRGINILFPDPWHKKRHHKRRPINEDFFTKAHSLLKSKAEIFVATDWEEYYEYIENESDKVKNLYTIEKGIYTPKQFKFPVTHYYKKWVALGGRKFQFIKLVKK